MSRADKASIFNMGKDEVMAPSGWEEDDIPMFFAESKVRAFWLGILRNHQVVEVEDLTPGSGCLASACSLVVAMSATALFKFTISGFPDRIILRVEGSLQVERFVIS